MMTSLLFVGTFCISIKFVMWIVERSFAPSSSIGEEKTVHPLLTALELFVVWAATVLSNIMTLKFFFNADGKMRAFGKAVSSENFGLRSLKILTVILFYIVLLFGTQNVIFSIAKDMRYSTKLANYYLPNPIDHFWQAVVALYIFVTPSIFGIHCMNGIVQRESVVPYSLKFFNLMMIIFGYFCFIGWSVYCICTTLPSYDVISMVYLTISLLSLSQWFGESTVLTLTMYEWFLSFMSLLQQLMIFLTRLSQVILVFLPLDGFGTVQKHLIYLLLLFLFGNNDLFGTLFRGGFCCSRDPPQEQQRTWTQFLCAGFRQLIHFLLAAYRTVWVFILIVPGLHTAAMQFSPGRLSLRIFSIWNLLVFVVDMLQKRSARLALEEENDFKAAAVESGYMPLSGGEGAAAGASSLSPGERDVEMCAPAAVVKYIEVDDENKQVVGNVTSSVNLY